MTWFVAYETTSKRLRSVGTVVSDNPPGDVTIEELDFDYSNPPAGKRYEWNTGTASFDLKNKPLLPISKADFLRKLTPSEIVEIRSHRATDAQVEYFLTILEQADDVRLDHPDTIAALNYFEAQGWIDEGRAAEILSNG